MRYCSDDAYRTALNKMFHPDKRAPSFIFKQVLFLPTFFHGAKL